jgi:hypothetical protein
VRRLQEMVHTAIREIRDETWIRGSSCPSSETATRSCEDQNLARSLSQRSRRAAEAPSPGASGQPFCTSRAEPKQSPASCTPAPLREKTLFGGIKASMAAPEQGAQDLAGVTRFPSAYIIPETGLPCARSSSHSSTPTGPPSLDTLRVSCSRLLHPAGRGGVQPLSARVSAGIRVSYQKQLPCRRLSLEHVHDGLSLRPHSVGLRVRRARTVAMA